jgi:hypothetical protein
VVTGQLLKLALIQYLIWLLLVVVEVVAQLAEEEVLVGF